MTAPRGDAGVLEDVLRVEQALAFVYAAAVASGDAHVRALARRFVEHERRHLVELNRAVEAVGGRRVRSATPGSVDALARSLRITPVFTALSTPTEVLGFMLALERSAIGVLNDAHRELADDRLLQLATTILACQAQHVLVLRQALHADPLPQALEPGR